MYQRLFGFRPMAEPRPYHGVKFETQLLGVRRSELRDLVGQAKPMTKAWNSALANLALANLAASAPCLLT